MASKTVSFRTNTSAATAGGSAWIRSHQFFAKIAGGIVALVGALVVVGWILDIPALKAFLSGPVTMKANAALAFVFAGLCIQLVQREHDRRSQNTAQLLAVLVALIGGLTLVEYVTGWNFRMDQLMVLDLGTAGTSAPGRMAPATALCLLLVGIAIFILVRQYHAIAQSLALIVSFIALLAIVGYLYNVESLRRMGPYSSVAFHTAANLLLLSLAILLTQPERAIMGIVTSPTAGGLLARRLLPPAILVPVLLGRMRLAGQRAGLYDTEFGLSMMVLSMIVFLSLLIFWNARTLYHMDVRRRQLEDQLRQAQKMEAIGQLAGGIAHDFNNVLTAVIGYANMILSTIGEDNPIHRQVAEIEKAGNRAAAFTRQLLAFSRRQILQTSRVDLNVLVNEVHRFLVRIIGEDVELVQRLAPALWPVYGDRGQLEQVLMNLVVNSRDAMPSGGKITIETRNVILDDTYASPHFASKPGDYAMLAVSDTGAGMDKETQSRIFEPFFTTKAKEKGTGLGLATVYGIVQQSNGSIWVYSELGKGTTFKIYLPRDETPEPVVEDSPLALSVSGAHTILLVEDEELVRSLVCQILERAGYTVLKAVDPAEALTMCQRSKERIDLLVSDVVMPGMSGRSLSEEASTFRPDMKVLFMSGYTDTAIGHNGVLDAKTPFIQKPFTPPDFLRRVQLVLNGAEQGTPKPSR